MAEMALWVLQVGVVDGLLRGHRDYEMLQEAYKKDGQLRAIQVGNLTARLFRDLSRADLAEALLATNAELAGQIAAIEFERSRTTLCAESSKGFVVIWAWTRKSLSVGSKPLSRAIEPFTPAPRPRSTKYGNSSRR